jgi:MerR family copper efflux transcriptional regulator
MTLLTIRDVTRRSGLSGPTLRYYEEIGLIGPVDRDLSSGHRRYRDEDVNDLQILACMRSLGVGIEEMRTYQANRRRGGREVAAEQRDMLLRHADRIQAEIVAQHARLEYVQLKAALWDARHRGDAEAETEIQEHVMAAYHRLEL